MKDSYSKKISKFRRFFSILPPAERKMPIVEVNDRIFTWEEIHKEIIKKSKFSKKLLNKLEEMGLL
jgi:hypothetical protein